MLSSKKIKSDQSYEKRMTKLQSTFYYNFFFFYRSSSKIFAHISQFMIIYTIVKMKTPWEQEIYIQWKVARRMRDAIVPNNVTFLTYHQWKKKPMLWSEMKFVCAIFLVNNYVTLFLGFVQENRLFFFFLPFICLAFIAEWYLNIGAQIQW